MAEGRPAVVEQPSERARAFLRLADDHLDSGYRLARAILRDPTEAQDATHDAFEQAWRKWPTLRDPTRFQQWFDRILVNTCRDRLRSGRRQPTDISVEVAADTGDPFTQAHDRDLLTVALARTLARAPGRRRAPLLPGSSDRRDRQPARHSGRERSSRASITH